MINDYQLINREVCSVLKNEGSDIGVVDRFTRWIKKKELSQPCYYLHPNTAMNVGGANSL